MKIELNNKQFFNVINLREQFTNDVTMLEFVIIDELNFITVKNLLQNEDALKIVKILDDNNNLVSSVNNLTYIENISKNYDNNGIQVSLSSEKEEAQIFVQINEKLDKIISKIEA